MTYKIGLLVGGLPEDPAWRVEHIYDVESESIGGAKDKWAEISGLSKLPEWNSESKTYFGWGPVEIKQIT